MMVGVASQVEMRTPHRTVAMINKPGRPLVGARVGDHEGFNKL